MLLTFPAAAAYANPFDAITKGVTDAVGKVGNATKTVTDTVDKTVNGTKSAVTSVTNGE